MHKINESIVKNGEEIFLIKTSNASTFKTFCQYHDLEFATAFENSVFFKCNEDNCKLLYYRTINNTYMANKVLEDLIVNFEKNISPAIKNRINLINKKVKDFKKNKEDIKKTKSIIFTFPKTNIMFSGTYNIEEIIYFYKNIKKSNISYFSFKKEKVSINLFSDKECSKLVITSESEKESEFLFNFIIKEIKNGEIENFQKLILFLGIMSINCFFSPIWYENLNLINKKNILEITEYVLYKMINGIKYNINANSIFDFSDEAPFLLDQESYILIE